VIPKSIPTEHRFQWGPVPAVPFYLFSAATNAVPRMWAALGIGWPDSQLFFQNDQCLWIGDQREVDRLGFDVARRLIDHNYPLAEAYTEYQSVVANLRAIEAERVNWPNVDRNELTTRWLDLSRLVQQFWQWAILPEMAGYGVAAYLQHELPKVLSPETLNEALTTLTSADGYSFFQQEELALFELIRTGSVDEVSLRAHTERFSWLLGNYATNKPLGSAYFCDRADALLATTQSPNERIREITRRLEQTNQRRAQIVMNLPDGELKELAGQAGFFVRWHDDRKAEQLKFQLVLHHLLSALGRILAIPIEQLEYWTEDECLAALQGGPMVSADVVASRRTLSLGWLTTTGKHELLVGANVQKLYEEYQSSSSDLKLAELRGTVASSGSGHVIRSIARVLRHPNDSYRLAPGEVLVASMTSPEYIDAIRKAGAIVTDVGGLTSHAAIVSRELNIPCIVGTKLATKVLKDGDLVEVDATKGVVRKIT